MKKYCEAAVIAFSMYSKLPMPQIGWDPEGMKYAFCFFPLIGAVIGCVQFGLFFVSNRLDINQTAFALVGTAVPLLITGGIHMDGFLDTADARASLKSQEERLRILKDPHAGAFAVIGFGVYLLLYAAAFTLYWHEERRVLLLAAIYVLCRCLSGLSVLVFPKARPDGLAKSFSDGAGKKAPRAVLVLWFLAALVFTAFAGGPVSAAVLGLLALLLFGAFYRMCVREFGGITGDLAGYFLQCAELVLTWAAALVPLV